MALWKAILIIFLAGGLGGVVKSLLRGEGLLLPHWKSGFWNPGFLGNTFIGGMAALVFWGLYSSSSNVEVPLNCSVSSGTTISLKISSIAGAMPVGMGGTKWLSYEVDKQVLRRAASEAGRQTIPISECDQTQRPSPVTTFQIAQRFPKSDFSN